MENFNIFIPLFNIEVDETLLRKEFLCGYKILKSDDILYNIEQFVFAMEPFTNSFIRDITQNGANKILMHPYAKYVLFKQITIPDNDTELYKEKEKIKDGGKLYTKITDLLTNNSVINKSASKMNDKELLTFITRYISVPLPPPIKQEDFNDLVKVGIKEDNREALWRLAVNYDKKMDFTLIEDYFIDKRDSYYLIELISATDSVNLDNIVSKVVATNDREFMIDLENRSLELSIFTKDDIDKIKEKYNL